MPKHGKHYAAASEAIEDREYLLEEAVAVVKKNSFAKFDETVEIALVLGVDPKHADQSVRSTVLLPHGTGKSQKVAVIAQGEIEDGIDPEAARKIPSRLTPESESTTHGLYQDSIQGASGIPGP